MPLRTETTVEYYFNNPYMYYCKEHECLRVSEHHEDSVLCNGITQDRVNNFVSNYIGYVLDNEKLKEAFDNSLKEKDAEEDLTDCEGRPL
tara:strand:+ start:26 stop:295 length:270 start_codon:yes stop_codon:yes gene_type:complete